MATGGDGQGVYSEEYEYDPNGNLWKKGPDGAQTEYDYNDSNHRHAVTHLDDNLYYSYDANGNMTSRKVGAETQILTYDLENRLTNVSVGGESIAEFIYDGDGNRVKAIEESGSTVYIGNYYEYEERALVSVVPITNPGFESSGFWSEIWNIDFPGTSFFRHTSGIAAPHSGSYGYAISNQAYGRLESDDISVSPNTNYNLYA